MKKYLCLIFSSVAIMAMMGTSTVETKGEEASDEIELTNGSGVSFSKSKMEIYVPSDHSLRLYQITDSHFGDPTRNYHNGSPEKTKLLMDYIIDTAKPDVLVCTGDNYLGTGNEGGKAFFTMMSKYNLPILFCYGNHDSEGYSKTNMTSYLSSLDLPYLMFEEGYYDTSADRSGNYTVKVKDKQTKALNGAIFMLDSGAYDYTKGYYEYITTKQIDWYSAQVASLQKEYSGEGTVPSIEFQHIQHPEHYDAYMAAINKTDGASWVREIPTPDYGASEQNNIKTGGPSINKGFYQKMVDLGSTKASFVGHMHYMRWQVNYKGIIVGFAPQTGYANIFPKDSETKHAYVYSVTKGFSLTTEDYPQPFDIK